MINKSAAKGLSNTIPKIIDILITRRLYIFAGVLLLTVFFAYHAPGMKQDPTMKSGVNQDSPEYRTYQGFLDEFGNEEFILMAALFPEDMPIKDRLKEVDEVTNSIGALELTETVMSITNFKIFQKRGEYYGNFPVVIDSNGRMSLPSNRTLNEFADAISIFKLLISEDRLTFGIIIKLKEKARYDPPLIGNALDNITKIGKKHFSQTVDFRYIGGPVVRKAIEKYNLQTAVVFGILCLIIATVTSTYIFKSIRISLINMSVVAMSIIWMMGAMALLEIAVNSTTALAFGLSLLVSAAAVIHISTHFNERYFHCSQKPAAMKEALLVVGRPCFMCAVTTATGFASITVSHIPMIRQLGLIMAIAVMISYMLAIVVTPTLLLFSKPPTDRDYKRMESDWIAVMFNRLKAFVYGHSKVCALVIGALAIFMLSSIPYIKSDTQILRMLSERTQEMKDVRFVEDKLGEIHSIELVVNKEPGVFRKVGAWQEIEDVQERLLKESEVVEVDSLLPILKYLGRVVSDESNYKGIFDNNDLIPQLIAMISMSSGGKEIVGRYVGEDYSKARISVRIKNSPDHPMGATIDNIREAAISGLNKGSTLTVTGDLAFFESQASEIVRAQTVSLFIALTCITILMIIQFKSMAIGLMSLIPNVLPLAMIFGSMGWFGIPLDTVTVFAATVSIGLSVDDTIHYLTQLKREMLGAKTGDRIRDCLDRAYIVTAKALITTSVVLFAGFIVLLGSPFKPVIHFGILGALAILAAMIGDLVFMPALILSIPVFRRMMERRLPQ